MPSPVRRRYFSPMRETSARVLFAITALISFVGVCMSAGLSAVATPAEIAKAGGIADPATFDLAVVRFLNTFTYFTILSNIIVIVTCTMLVIGLHRSSTVFRTFRVFGLVAIIITGLVYNIVLAPLSNPQGLALIENTMVHIITPVLAFLGWLIFGPRNPFRLKYVGWAMAIGLVWIAFTLARGAMIHWYPYPFVDVDNLGYPTVLINCAAILVFAAVLALAILGLDKVLPGIPSDPKETQRDSSSAEAIDAATTA